MLASAMLYCLLIAALLGIAAALAERLAAAAGVPRRFVWITALAGSLLLPAAMLAAGDGAASSERIPRSGQSLMADINVGDPRTGLYPSELHGAIGPRLSAAELEAAASESPATNPPFVPGGPQSSSAQTPANDAADPDAQNLPGQLAQRIDAWMQRTWTNLSAVTEDWNAWLSGLWATTSLVLFVAFARAWSHLLQAARRWPAIRVADNLVRISENTGPAVFGVLHPSIVLPRWVLEAPTTTQSMIVAHEYEHILARDPLVLWLSQLALILLPWNAPLWWMQRRLRLAMEIDCDARVLRRRGHIETAQYGEALLQVNQRPAVFEPCALTMARSTHQLERRIHIMLGSKPTSAATTAALLFLSSTLVAAAAQVQAPSGGTALSSTEAASPTVVQTQIAYTPVELAPMLTITSPAGANPARSAVEFASMLPDGQHVLSVSQDAVRIWEVASGEQIAMLDADLLPPVDGQREWFSFAVASPDGRRVLTVSSAFHGPAPNRAITRVPNGKRSLSIWDIESGTIVAQLGEGTQSLVYTAAFSPDGQRVVTAAPPRMLGADGQPVDSPMLMIWNAATGDLLTTVTDPIVDEQHSFPSIAFSADGGRIVTTSWAAPFCPTIGSCPLQGTGLIRVWDSTTGALLVSIESGSDYIPTSALFSPDGTRIVSAAFMNRSRIEDPRQSRVQIHDAATGELLATPFLLEGQIQYADYTADGETVHAFISGHHGWVWNSSDLQRPAVLIDDEYTSSAATIIPTNANRASGDGKLASWSDRNIYVWNLRDIESIPASRVPTLPPASIGYWPDVPTDAPLIELLRSVAVSADGQRVFGRRFDNEGWIQEPASGNLTWLAIDDTAQPESRLQETITAASFSPDGGTLLTVSQRRLIDNATEAFIGTETFIQHWDAASGDLLHEYPTPAGASRVVFSPDGQRFATSITAQSRTTLEIRDFTTGALIHQLDNDGFPRTSPSISLINASQFGYLRLAFSPDGAFLAVLGGDGAVWIWNTASGALHTSLQPEFGVRFLSFSFSPDTQRIVTTSASATDIRGNLLGGWVPDSIVREWDTDTGTVVATHVLESVYGPLRDAVYTQDGQRIFAITERPSFYLGVLDVLEKTPIALLPLPPGAGSTNAGEIAVWFSADRRTITTTNSIAPIRIWNLDEL